MKSCGRKLFPINAPGVARFKLFDLVNDKVSVRVRIWDIVRVTVRVMVTVMVRLSKVLGSA